MVAMRVVQKGGQKAAWTVAKWADPTENWMAVKMDATLVAQLDN